MKLRIHDVIKGSRVNGPGNRYVIWFQGCSIHCPDCFNKDLWKFEGGKEYWVSEVVDDIRASGCEGVTISGGEPFDQYIQLFGLVYLLSHPEIQEQLTKGIICFSGYDFSEISRKYLAESCINNIDLLIAGRYDESQKQDNALAGSSNQEFIWNPAKGRGKDKISEDEVMFDQEVEVHPVENFYQKDKQENVYKVTGFPQIEEAALKEFGIEIIE